MNTLLRSILLAVLFTLAACTQQRVTLHPVAAPQQKDGNWHGIGVASNGDVYFNISTHERDLSAYIYRLRPGRQPELLGDLAVITNTPVGPGNFVPQGKVHTPIFENKGKMWFATHVALVTTPEGYKPYPGGYFVSVDMKTKAFALHGKAPEGEGIITLAEDVQSGRGKLYGLTWPSAIFLVYDMTSDTVTNVGSVDDVLPEDKRHKHQCRYLGVDPETGRVYGSRLDGSIYAYDPADGKLHETGANVQAAIIGPVENPEKQSAAWRTIRYDAATRCFYGLHHGTASLFRFDPRENTVRPIIRLSTKELQESSKNIHTHLAFELTPDRVIYHLTPGVAQQIEGKPELKEQTHLVSYNLNTGVYADHGPITSDDGVRMVYTDSTSLAPDGSIWSLAHVEAPPSADGKPQRDRVLVHIRP